MPKDRLGTEIQKGDIVVDMSHQDCLSIGVALGGFTPLYTRLNYMQFYLWGNCVLQENAKLKTHHLLIVAEDHLPNLIEKLVVKRLELQERNQYGYNNITRFTEGEIRAKIQEVLDMSREMKEEG